MRALIQRLKEDFSLTLHRTLGLLLGLIVRRRRLVVFCNYRGRGYGDNLSPVAEEIRRRNIPVRMVWLVRNLHEEIPEGIEKLKLGWIREKLLLSSANVFLSNTKDTPFYWKRRGAYYIQTWHGDMPFKYIEAECKDMLSRYYRLQSIGDSLRTDYILSGSSFFSNLARNSFWYPDSSKILEYGIPRNDIFFKTSAKEVLDFKRKKFGAEDVKVVLYAPTFREKTSNQVCKLDAFALRQAVEKRFGGRWIVVVRLHPLVAKYATMFEYDEKTVNGTLIEEGQLLSLAADLLVSDYSSIVEEFIIQKKPVFLYVPDIDRYINEERKLRDLYFKLPFPRCEDMDSLVREIALFDGEAYRRKLNQFIDADYQIFDDGHASERVVDLIENLIDEAV